MLKLYNVKLKHFMGEDVTIIKEDGYYKVRLTNMNNNKEIRVFKSRVFLRYSKRMKKINVFVNTGTNKITASVSDTMQTRAAIADSQQAPAVSYKTQIVESANKIRHKFIFLNNNSPWLKRINYFGKSVILDQCS